MRIWEDLSLCDYQQITLMCNDTKVIDQRESDLNDRFPTRWTVTPPPPTLTAILSTGSTILKYHR
jgi:hypothetical protein